MWRIALFLIFTLIAVPILTFLYDEPLNELQFSTLMDLVYLYLITATGCFLVSSLTDNYSQVDKLWSIMPIPYVWIVAHHSGYEPRMMVMAALVSAWGARLTFNFARRGGYSIKFWTGEEDYRWSILRAKAGFEQKWKWVLFNFFFISFYQMGLILIMTLPIVKSMGAITPLGWTDYLLAGIIFLLIVIEFVADQQQFRFQSKKHQKMANNEELSSSEKAGFTHTGLWAYMRHPNYMAEQSIWIVFYFFSVIATGHWVNWSIAGALLLVLLFKGSSDFSEEISTKKYPIYARYKKEVGRFLPIKGKFKF